MGEIYINKREGEFQLNRPIEELTLLLLHLTAWEEEVPLCPQAAEGLQSAALSQLEKDGFIVNITHLFSLPMRRRNGPKTYAKYRVTK